MAARAKKTSSPPLSLKSLRFDLERPAPGFYRADIEFYGVDHSGASLEARVFIDNADANASTAMEPGQGYVDSFCTAIMMVLVMLIIVDSLNHWRKVLVQGAPAMGYAGD